MNPIWGLEGTLKEFHRESKRDSIRRIETSTRMLLGLYAECDGFL